jgi:hypothetical protein
LKSPELKLLQENHSPTSNALQRKLPHGRPCQSSHSKHSRVGSPAQPKGDAPRPPVYAHPCCGRPKTEFLISNGEPTEIIADVIAAQDFPHRKLLTTNVTLIIASIRRPAAAIGLDLTPAFSRVRATRAPPS